MTKTLHTNEITPAAFAQAFRACGVLEGFNEGVNYGREYIQQIGHKMKRQALAELPSVLEHYGDEAAWTYAFAMKGVIDAMTEADGALEKVTKERVPQIKNAHAVAQTCLAALNGTAKLGKGGRLAQKVIGAVQGARKGFNGGG